MKVGKDRKQKDNTHHWNHQVSCLWIDWWVVDCSPEKCTKFFYVQGGVHMLWIRTQRPPLLREAGVSVQFLTLPLIHYQTVNNHFHPSVFNSIGKNNVLTFFTYSPANSIQFNNFKYFSPEFETHRSIHLFYIFTWMCLLDILDLIYPKQNSYFFLLILEREREG